MPIKKDLSDLPAAVQSSGVPPAKNPKMATLIAEKWYADYVAAGETSRSKALPDLPYRASWAGLRCDRALWAAMHEVPESNPPGLADSWRFSLGNMVGDSLQNVMASLEGWVGELEVDLRPAGIDGSAHVDLAKPREDGVGFSHVVEVKTVNGFAFKKCATGFKGAPTGPRMGHVLQAAAAAVALDADKVGVVYLAMENVSPDLAKAYCDNIEVGRFAAEWWYNVDNLRPMVEREAARIRRLYASPVTVYPVIDDEETPPGAVVVVPSTGVWQLRQNDQIITTGKHWMCNYCRHQDWCVEVTQQKNATEPTSIEEDIF